MQLIIQIFIYGSALGMLFFLVASGFSLIFGLMRVLNYSHGSLFMLGGFVGYFTASYTGSFALGLLAGGLAAGILGLFMERLLIRPLKGNLLNQILLTFGLIYIFDEVARMIFGTRAYIQTPPEFLRGSTIILGETVPIYRIFMIFAGVAIFIAMQLLLQKTKLGMIIRAGIEKPRMVQAIGVNINLVFAATFALGCFLAGLGGAIAGPFLGAHTNIGIEQIFNAIAVVVIGGVGNFAGTFVAAILLGIVQYTISFFVPELAMASTLLLMIAVIIFKPNGLFGGAVNG